MRTPAAVASLAVSALLVTGLTSVAPVSAAVPSLSTVKATPVTIDAGFAHTVYLDVAGLPYGLGSNSTGQITGSGNTATPRELTGLPIGVVGEAVSAEGDSTLVLGSDGNVYGTGANTGGSLTGAGAKSTLTKLTGLPPGVHATDVSLGLDHALVLGNDGIVYGTGSNAAYQVPNASGTAASLSTLTPLDALPNSDVPARVFTGPRNSAVIAADGSIYGAGENNDGQLTQPFSRTTWKPFQPLPSGYQAVSVVLGARHSSILMADGHVWSTGVNTGYGVFGTGDESGDGVVPVQATTTAVLRGLTSNASGYQNLAVDESGVAYGVGANDQYKLSSLPLNTKILSYTALPAPAATYVEVASGRDFSLLRDANGVVYGTGKNDVGQLGAGPATRTTVTVIPGQTLVPVGGATITGTAVVDQVLTAHESPWSPSVGTSAFQWTRDGADILGATAATYQLAAEDAGHTVRVRETRTATDFVSGGSLSGGVLVAPGTFTGTAPTVGGAVRVGSTLTLTGGGFSPVPTTVTRQWLRNGVPVAGRTGVSYLLGSSDAGRIITVRMTATRAGYTDRQVDATGKRVPAYNAKRPTFSGTMRVGKTLTAAKGTWYGAGYGYRFQWLRNGHLITGATRSTYKITRADRLKNLSVRVRATKAGFATVTAVSGARKVS